MVNFSELILQISDASKRSACSSNMRLQKDASAAPSTGAAYDMPFTRMSEVATFYLELCSYST